MSRRRGFTLVELMVTMVIIACLAGMVMGGLFLAQEKAKATRTRTIITRLNRAVMARWESYRTRRLPISTSDGANDPTPLTPFNQADSAVVRLAMIRELMRMEMPTRWDDITVVPVSLVRIIPGSPPTIVPIRPALSTAYLRRYTNNVDEAGTAIVPSGDFQSAECLHLIVTMGGLDDEAEGLDRFRHEDVGDIDHDGMREFHDGWGQPISWVRWPAGFVSDLQPDADPSTVDDPVTTPIENIERDAVNNHDPFDQLKLDMPPTPAEPRGWRMIPLIYSPGPDGVQDLFTVNTATTAAELTDPYFRPSGGQFAGEPFDTDQDGYGHIDNIHSHFIGGAVR